MVRQEPDQLDEDRTLTTRWFDLGLKATGLLKHRRVWIALCIVFGALGIVGAIVSSEELPPI